MTEYQDWTRVFGITRKKGDRDSDLGYRDSPFSTSQHWSQRASETEAIVMQDAAAPPLSDNKSIRRHRPSASGQVDGTHHLPG